MKMEKGLFKIGWGTPSPGLADTSTGPAMHALKHSRPHWLHCGVHRIRYHK